MIVIGGLSAVFAAFGYRLFNLHVVQHRELQAAASATRERVVHRPGRRGQILDARGNLLANSQSVRIVAADPSITTSQAVRYAQSLAPLLHMDANQLLVKLSGEGRYVRLKQKVDEETVQKIRDLKLKGLTFEDQFVRTYPNGSLASHVLGFVDSEHKGVQGVEASLDSYLRGRAGYEVIERDRRGREMRAFRGSEIGPQDGYNVVLTIDQVIQHIAEKELDQAMSEHRPQGGVIIVTKPKTGEILAMASRPTFDVNRPGDVPPDARRNRCISDVAEPGSTFKIVVAAAALNENLARLSDRFDCENGAWLHAGRVLHDAHPYGVLTLEEIVYHSSNIGAAKIAVERLGAARLYEYIRRFGFGKRTGIALPGEVSGIAHPLNRWTNLSITRIPMGHEIAATPLQMIMAMNAMANGGQLMRPMIVKRVMNADGSVFQEFEPQVTAQVIHARTKIAMTAALRRVPTSEGTAPKAAVPGYEAAGKTGTAQKIENGRYVSRYYSSFCGYLPASDAEISILVSLDDPSGRSYYGGTVAGPVFRNVAEKVAQYLGIPPQVAPNEVKVASVL